MEVLIRTTNVLPPMATLSQSTGITFKVTFQQPQNFHLNELEKIKRMNDVSLKAMQNQIDMLKNELRNEMKTSISNQTNEIKNMMASLLQMNTASTSGSRTLPGNTIANPKGELKAITTRSVLVTEGPTVPNPPKSVNPEEDEYVEETYTYPDHAEYNIKVPPPPPKKQQEKDEVQIYKFWQIFKQLHINITLADALILIPKYQKMLKALLSNKEKLQELANIPLNKNCSAIILKKLLEKLRDPRKFLILCGFSELKCKALADLGNTIANPKGELKAINTRSGLVTEGPTVPNPSKSVNPEEDECVEETYTDTNHTEYNIKVPPPPPV
nr:hypothetical protein [Tanacetum cinerariifolium]